MRILTHIITIETHVVRKTQLEEDRFEKIPLNMIISLVYINLKTQLKVAFLFFVLQVMKSFMCNENIILDLMPWNKCTLIVGNKAQEMSLQSTSHQFRKDLVCKVA